MAKLCKGIKFAEFRHKITFQAEQNVGDGMGGGVTTWGVITNGSGVWAKIDPTNGYERYQADRYEQPITHKIYCRYFAGVTCGQRILFGARTFQIAEVINLEEQNIYLKILAVEVVDG